MIIVEQSCANNKFTHPASSLISSLVGTSCVFILFVVSTLDMFPAAQEINPCSKKIELIITKENHCLNIIIHMNYKLLNEEHTILVIGRQLHSN